MGKRMEDLLLGETPYTKLVARKAKRGPKKNRRKKKIGNNNRQKKAPNYQGNNMGFP